MISSVIDAAQTKDQVCDVTLYQRPALHNPQESLCMNKLHLPQVQLLYAIAAVILL
jgi:hypothetical protein